MFYSTEEWQIHSRNMIAKVIMETNHLGVLWLSIILAEKSKKNYIIIVIINSMVIIKFYDNLPCLPQCDCINFINAIFFLRTELMFQNGIFLRNSLRD